MKTTIERRPGFVVIRRGAMPPKAIREPMQVIEPAPEAAADLDGTLLGDIGRRCRNRLAWPREFLATALVGE